MTGGHPRELQGNGESNPRARSNNEGPVHAAPSARLSDGLEGPRKHDVSRRPDYHFQPGRAAPQGRPRLSELIAEAGKLAGDPTGWDEVGPGESFCLDPVPPLPPGGVPPGSAVQMVDP